jgi:hypothetical protein
MMTGIVLLSSISGKRVGWVVVEGEGVGWSLEGVDFGGVAVLTKLHLI